MKEDRSYEFCMSQFKPAIAVLAIVVVLIIGWAVWNCSTEMMQHRARGLGLAAAATPPASNIDVKAKMPHAYWGNCNKCHISINVSPKPVSKVFAGATISIDAPMPHKYWGNCNLCHKITGGFAPQFLKGKTPAMQVAGFSGANSETLGLKLQTVTIDLMRQMGLANEDGVLILDVAAGSAADLAGLKAGDEIIRAGNFRLDTVMDFDAAVAAVGPGGTLKVNIYRGSKSRNLHINIPAAAGGSVAAAVVPNRPVTKEQFPSGIGNSQISLIHKRLNAGVGNSPILLGQGTPAAITNYGKVAIASQGPALHNSVSPLFDTSPYFIVYDPVRNSTTSVVNPNFNDLTGRGVQSSQYMVDIGVSNVVAGSFSSESFNALSSLRIQPYSGVTGPVRDVLTMYAGGQIRPETLSPDTAAAQNNPALQRGALF